jgi:hypothetical protein
MRAIFEYKDSNRVKFTGPIIAIFFGFFVILFSRSNYLLVGCFLTFIGSLGILYSFRKKNNYLIISAQKLYWNKGEIQFSDIFDVNRCDFNESIYYEFKMKNGSVVIVKAPYIPNKEKAAWHIIKNYKVTENGHQYQLMK